MRCRLPATPRGIYEFRLSVQRSEERAALFYELFENRTDGVLKSYGDPVTVVASPTEETELLREVDIKDEIEASSALFVRVTTNSTHSLGFVMHVEALHPIGRYRVLLGSLLLVFVYGLLLLEVINRSIVAFIGAFLALLLYSLIFEAPELSTVVGWMDESTLCLLFGMMIMIQLLSTTGFFEFMAIRMFILSKSNALALNFALCMLTTVCSAFLDNVTTMLLIAPVTIEVCGIMKMSPIPFLLPEVVFSNIGGTATQIGDPPNIIIGNMLSDYLGFIDFIKHCTPNVLLCIVFVYPVVILFFRDEFKKANCQVDKSLVEKYQIKNKPLLLKCGTILASVIIMFFLHPVHHINTSYIAIAGAFACLLLGTNDDLHTTFELLEWETLVFFAGLFIMIECINELGVIRAIGNGVSSLIEHAPMKWRSLIAHMLILWVSGIVSSVLDNIAFIATMIPVIQILAANETLRWGCGGVSSLDLDICDLAWTLAFGACFGGNGTLVGAGANLVTAGISTSKGYPITFRSFFKFGATCTLVTLVVSTFYVIVRYVNF